MKWYFRSLDFMILFFTKASAFYCSDLIFEDILELWKWRLSSTSSESVMNFITFLELHPFKDFYLIILYRFHLIANGCIKERGYCVQPNGDDQNSGVLKVNSLDGNTQEHQQACLKKCLTHPGATGCEVIWDQSNRGCYIHTQSIARGNNRDRHNCWVFSKCKQG